MTTVCGAEIEARELLADLTVDASWIVPNVDLDDPLFDSPDGLLSELMKPVARLTIDQLTDGTILGTGVFDRLMQTVSAQLKSQKDLNLISGAEYTKAYIAMVQVAMTNGVQFLVQQETLFWQSEAAQIAAIMARVQLMEEKVKYAELQFSAMNAKATYALTQMNIADAEIGYCIKKYTLMTDMPIQTQGLTLDNETKQFNLSSMLPAQLKMLLDQDAGVLIENDTRTYNLHTTLPLQTIGMTTQNGISAYTLATTMPLQTTMLQDQIAGVLLENAGRTIANNTATYNLSTTLPLQTAGTTTQNATLSYNLVTTLPLQTQMLTEQVAGETYTVTTMMPAQHDQLVAQTAGVVENTAIATYNLISMMPEQLLMLEAQKDGVVAQTGISQYTLTNMMPEQLALLTNQAQGAADDNAIKEFQVQQLMPAQLQVLDVQKIGYADDNAIKEFQLSQILPQSLLTAKEQVEVARAQTLETRTDGTVIMGSVGAQKNLYLQQIQSYKRDAELKVVKLYTDAWNVQKTMDIGVDPPDQFTNVNLNTALIYLRQVNQIGDGS